MKINNRKIVLNTTIIEALKKMDVEKVKSLVVFENNQLQGLLTIGDIQRAILKGIELTSPISSILDKNKIYASADETIESVKKKMSRLRAECMPVVNNEGNLVDVYFWKDLYGEKERNTTETINIPVIIMAGGKGTRLAPLTNVYPKPLIPVGEKTIVETIMDKFVSYGCHNFYMSVNYKADTIKNYFDFIDKPYFYG